MILELIVQHPDENKATGWAKSHGPTKDYGPDAVVFSFRASTSKGYAWAVARGLAKLAVWAKGQPPDWWRRAGRMKISIQWD